MIISLLERGPRANEHFQEYPGLHMKREDLIWHLTKSFMEKRSKTEKEAYLIPLSSKNWNEGKVVSTEGKKDHSLTSCQACLSFNSQLQSTFPLSKVGKGLGRDL